MQESYEEGCINILILQIRKQRFQELKYNLLIVTIRKRLDKDFIPLI